MGKIAHPRPSSLPLLENIVAVDVIGVDVVDDADANADAEMLMLIY
jgi:hypothetical protein